MPQTKQPALMPAAAAKAYARPRLIADRSTSAVSMPGMIVSSPATTANPRTACVTVMRTFHRSRVAPSGSEPDATLTR